MRLFSSKKSNSFMKTGGKILAVLLAVCLTLGSLTLPAQQANAAQPEYSSSALGTEPGTLRVGGLQGIAATLAKSVISYAVKFGVTRLTYAITYSGNEDLIKLFKLITNAPPNPTMDLCKEIMKTVTEIDYEVQSSRAYLGGVIAQFSEQASEYHLDDMQQAMSQTISPMANMEQAYQNYLESVEQYTASRTQSNKDNMDAHKTLLMQAADKYHDAGFQDILLKYMSYTSTKKNSVEVNTAKTYLYYCNELCDKVYMFDYQKYNAMIAALNENICTIAEMLYMMQTFISLKEDAGASDADMTVYEVEYNDCLELALMAVNDIGDQYSDELDKMVRSYDLHTQEVMNYTETSNREITYKEIPAIGKDLTYTFNYDARLNNDDERSSLASGQVSSPTMNFYRVGALAGDGVYLILKEAADSNDTGLKYNDIENQHLFQHESRELSPNENPGLSAHDMFSWVLDQEYYNLLATSNGNYQMLTDLNSITGLIGTQSNSYDANGSNLLYWMQAGGLSAFSGYNTQTMPYLLLNKTHIPDIHTMDGNLFDMHVNQNFYCGKIAQMTRSVDGIDATALAEVSKGGSEGNCVVILEQTQVPEYTVDYSTSGSGWISVSADGNAIPSGAKVAAGSELEITVSTMENDVVHTLDSLTIKGEDKPYLTESEETEGFFLSQSLADTENYESAKLTRANPNGSVTYYFRMPYQNCHINASFGFKEENIEYYNLYLDTGENGTAQVMEGSGDLLLDSQGQTSIQVPYGDNLTVLCTPEDNYVVDSVRLLDQSGEVLLELSALAKTGFAMPNQDCTLSVTFRNSKDDPVDGIYYIPDYETLAYYFEKMSHLPQGDETNRDATNIRKHFMSAHYVVTNDIDCGDGTQTALPTPRFAGEHFMGTFDGAGHTISHLRMSNEWFANIGTTGLVENLILVDSRSEAGENNMASALICSTNYGVIHMVRFSETVLNFSAFADYNEGRIINCGLDSTCAFAKTDIGGIAYWNNKGEILNCYTVNTTLTEKNYKGTISNCYTVQMGNTAIANESDGTIQNVYFNGNSGSYEWGTPMSADQMNKDAFADTLNSNLTDGYATWVRDDSTNNGFPCFDVTETPITPKYQIDQEVLGSGSVVLSRANGGDLSSGAEAGEVINAQVIPTDGAGLIKFSLYGTKSGQSYGDILDSFIMPSEDVTVKAVFENLAGTIKISTYIEGNGELYIRNEAGEEIGEAMAGETVYIQAVDGYNQYGDEYLPAELTRLALQQGGSFNILEDFGTEHEVSFAMPAERITVYARFGEAGTRYVLDGAITGDGSGTASQTYGTFGTPTMVSPGSLVRYYFAPDEGSTIKSVKGYTSNGSVYQTLISSEEEYDRRKNDDGSLNINFYMPKQDAAVQVEFVKKQPEPTPVYEIYSYEDLTAMAANIQSYPEKYAAATYTLMNDIDCGGAEWSLPIGTDGTPFDGLFEGQGYVIQNLIIKNNAAGLGGLFGVIGKNGTVQNLSTLQLIWEEPTEYAGGIAAVNYGTIDFCISGINIGTAGDESGYIESDTIFGELQSKIRGKTASGGIAAYSEGTITNSRNNALVLDAASSGGITGINKGTITNFYNIGHVFGTSEEGGVAGKNEGTISIGYTAFAMEVSKGEASGQVVGTTSNTDLKDVYYNTTGVVSGDGKDNSAFAEVAYQSDADIRSAEFAETLNKAAEGKGLGKWVYDSSKNHGYPRIEKISIEKASVTGLGSKTYTGTAITPTVTVKLNDKILDKDTDFDVSYKKNTNAGKAIVTITGKGKYGDSLTKTFTIKPAALYSASLSYKTVAYNGSAKKPKATVKAKVGGTTKTLKASSDYKVTYLNNKYAGLAAVIIKGTGNYSGTKTLIFTVSKAKNPLIVKKSSATYKRSRLTGNRSFKIGATKNRGKITYSLSKSAKAAKIKVSSTGVVTVPKNCKKGTYKITVKAAGTNNYKAGTRTVTVKVV